MKTNPTILIITGEPSGDILGSHLARELKQQIPCHIKGVGADQMQAAGVEIIFSSDKLAVIGAVEIIKKFGVLKNAMKTLTQILENNPPDLLILIDYPGFNLRLAARAKKLGVKVMFYVSPQIWAWHYSRIKKIKKNVDLMAVLFPFEEKLYQKENVPVKFVGHPLVESIKATLDKIEASRQFNINLEHPVIGLLPGSRLHEIDKLLPEMLAAKKSIQNKIPNAQFILPLAANLNKSILKPYDLTGITVVTNNTYNALSLCDAAIVTSGTVTLEVALLQVPMVIVYKVSKVNAFIGKLVTDLDQIGLCNIVAEERVALELLQEKVKTNIISEEIIRIINDSDYRNGIKQKLSTLKNKLQSENASKKAAEAAATLLT